MIPKPAGCPPDESPEQADRDYAEGLAAIARADEHPTTSELDAILPPLRRAALSGHPGAQLRYGYYVVSYWFTDEMFWPKQRETAVTALAMLRVAARRGARGVDDIFAGLAKDPVAMKDSQASALPKAWLQAAVAEANRWEHCHPR